MDRAGTHRGNQSRVLPGIHIQREMPESPPASEPAHLQGSGQVQVGGHEVGMGCFPRDQVTPGDRGTRSRKASCIAYQFAGKLDARSRHLIEIGNIQEYWGFGDPEIDAAAAPLLQRARRSAYFPGVKLRLNWERRPGINRGAS